MLSVTDYNRVINSGMLEKYTDQGLLLLNEIFQREAKYADSLGWLDPDEWAADAALETLQAKASEVRQEADVFVLIGVGGSNQAARAVIKALDGGDGPEILYAGNTLAPHSMNRLLKSLERKSVYINVIAKNFETLEPGICFRMLRSLLEARYGEQAARRVIATGTPGSPLHRMAQAQGYTFLTFPENIGGRYSCLSDVGLFPMAVAGADIYSLVRGAREMAARLRDEKTAENPAVRYAALRRTMLEQGRGIEALAIFEPRLRYFGKWWVQLFAESEGKDDRGLFPVCVEYSEDLHSLGQFMQQGSAVLFETFLSAESTDSDVEIQSSTVTDGFDYLNGTAFSQMNRAAEQAALAAHGNRFPCAQMHIPKIDEYSLGGLFYFFMLSCYISGRLLGVNPFDQPGVEAYKQGMFDRLGKHK